MSGFYFSTDSVQCLGFLHRRDGKALERFLQDYFDGKLKRYLKSEPIPENNDGPVKVSRRMRRALQAFVSSQIGQNV